MNEALERACKAEGARLFPTVPSVSTRGHRHTLEHRRAPLNFRKRFHFEYDRALAQLARKVVEAPSSEVSSSCLDSWAWVTLLEQGLDQVTSGGASPQPAVAL